MPENSPPERPKRRGPGKPFPKGVSGNPGGKPKALREIEAMLDAEHRTVENMRAVFGKIREVSMGVVKDVWHKGAVCGQEIEYSAAWMDLYVNRLLGPVKELKIDLTDAPDEVVAYLAEKLN
jgi:hypothetical protein